MASLVFLVGWIFIAVLLVRDSRRRPSVSTATWIPTAMLFVLFSRTPMFSWLGSPDDAALPPGQIGNLLDQSFFSIMIMASLVITISRRVNWRSFFRQNKALIVFYAFFFMSIGWSQDPTNSLIRVIKDGGCTVVVLCVILSEKNPLEALRAVYVRCACILIPLSAILVRFSSLGKAYAHDGGVVYGGACQTKNELGEMLLISIMFLVWDFMERRSESRSKRMWRGFSADQAFLVLVGLWLLNLSQSKTSLVTLIIGLSLILRTGKLDLRPVSRFIFAGAISYPVLALTGQTLFGPLLGMLGRDATFTGRANIWEQINWNTVNPIVGAGFWNFWGGPGGRAIEAAMQTGIPNAHDGYLDIYLDGGFVGVAILACLLIVRGYKLIQRLPRETFARVQFAFLTVAIIHNVTESSFARLSGMWFTIILALLDFPEARKVNQTKLSKTDRGRAKLASQVDEKALSVSGFGDAANF